MDVIVAGENPVATDMVAAGIMGFAPREVPTFEWANGAGLEAASLDEVEVRLRSLWGPGRSRRPAPPARAGPAAPP
jgi:uncharacterized protein (DUF362 family)